jgi:hypothetical protein
VCYSFGSVEFASSSLFVDVVCAEEFEEMQFVDCVIMLVSFLDMMLLRIVGELFELEIDQTLY